MAAAAEAVCRRLGVAVRGRHMAVAERAIRTRLPLVDQVLEVPDGLLCFQSSPPPRAPEPYGRLVVVLNKADLAGTSETAKWMACMKKQSSRGRPRASQLIRTRNAPRR
nr:unnamed protein product [Digitaria exilis]